LKEHEFDGHARTYTEVLDESIAFVGGDHAYFAEYKIRDLHREVVASRGDVEGLKILDFGCGVGESVPYVARYFRKPEITAVDVSEESLNVARTRYDGQASFVAIGVDGLSAEISGIDAAYAMCVFHHIDWDMHIDMLSAIHERLNPGGMLMIYEHNPLNPLTVRVVNNCPFDANARLIRGAEMAERCRKAGFHDVSVHYRVFFPGFLKPLAFLEGALTWLPLGGQYYVRAYA